MNDLDSFKNGLINACDEEYKKSIIKDSTELRNQFNKEYPISRLREMELEDYVTGKESEDNFCYKIEFGKYKDIGVGIKGGSAVKFGIFYSKKDQKYRISSGGPKTIAIDNPEEYWKDFRKQLCDFLEECGKEDFSFNFIVTERYPKLFRMGIVLNKLCFLYYPDKFLNLTHRSSVFVFKQLGIENYDKYDRVQMPFVAMRELKAKVPELFTKEYDAQVIGNAVWSLMPLKESKANESDENTSEESIIGGENIIYYGNPGCGKSYIVKKEYESGDYQSYHTVFHPDYTNSDFVGQILPSVSENGVSYRAVPGPFTKALSYAINHPYEKVSLIIDEINRGNAAAILGDILQLLDRDDEGRCEYEINNDFIETYCDLQKVSIPSNLWVIATMNTSDQNVYPLDTAFKRRWKLKRIRNVFDDSDYSQTLMKMYVPGTGCSWSDFVKRINRKISRNTELFGYNAEDKQIGVYFMKKRELSEIPNDPDEKKINEFGEKVLMYLWEDVAKINRTSWFDNEYLTLDDLLLGFKEKGLRVIKDFYEDGYAENS